MCKQRKRKTTQKSCRVGTKSLCLSKRLISRVTSANPAISGTLASLVRPQLRSPAFDRVLQGQNELARRAVLLSLYSAGRTKPSVPLRHHRRGTWPCLTSTAFPAFPAANDWIAPALLARREHYLDATRHRPDEMRLPRCRVATSSRREIPARPAPIAKRQHKPTPTQGVFLSRLRHSLQDEIAFSHGLMGSGRIRIGCQQRIDRLLREQAAGAAEIIKQIGIIGARFQRSPKICHCFGQLPGFELRNPQSSLLFNSLQVRNCFGRV